MRARERIALSFSMFYSNLKQTHLKTKKIHEYWARHIMGAHPNIKQCVLRYHTGYLRHFLYFLVYTYHQAKNNRLEWLYAIKIFFQNFLA